MKNKIKIYILLYIQIIAYLYGYYAPKNITNSGNSSTRVKQTYRFDQIPDDGSYTLSIENISGNINITVSINHLHSYDNLNLIRNFESNY